jgi:hypothetical protein
MFRSLRAKFKIKNLISDIFLFFFPCSVLTEYSRNVDVRHKPREQKNKKMGHDFDIDGYQDGKRVRLGIKRRERARKNGKPCTIRQYIGSYGHLRVLYMTFNYLGGEITGPAIHKKSLPYVLQYAQRELKKLKTQVHKPEWIDTKNGILTKEGWAHFAKNDNFTWGKNPVKKSQKRDANGIPTNRGMLPPHLLKYAYAARLQAVISCCKKYESGYFFSGQCDL